MRVQSDTTLSFTSKEAALADTQRTVFVQGSTARDLLANLRAAIAPFAAEQTQLGIDWAQTHIDLAGAGDGSVFMVLLRIVDVDAPDTFANNPLFIERDEEVGDLEDEPFLLPSTGSQSEVLARNSAASLRIIRQLGFLPNSPQAPGDWQGAAAFFQTLLAGASSGGGFTNLLAGARQLSAPGV